MASTLNMSNFANRDSLLGPEIKPADAMSRATGLNNDGVVGLQRQIMKGKFYSALLLPVCMAFFPLLADQILWWLDMKKYFELFSQLTRIQIYVNDNYASVWNSSIQIYVASQI